jgi:hypothetical protein
VRVGLQAVATASMQHKDRVTRIGLPTFIHSIEELHTVRMSGLAMTIFYSREGHNASANLLPYPIFEIVPVWYSSDVVIVEGAHYDPHMRALPLRVVLALGLLAQSSAGTPCSGPNATIAHASMPHAIHPGVTGRREARAAWQNASHSNCSHCPATACASVLPCAGATAGAAASRWAGFDLPLPHGISLIPPPTAPHLAPSQPPTPPPQSVA